MKGVTVAIADPIEPITEFDDRPAVKELIVKYRKPIDAVKKGLEDDPLYDQSKHDDLWILRFCLSHKKKKAKIALEAAKETLAFREKYALDEEDIREFPPVGKSGEHHPRAAAFIKYRSCCSDDAIYFGIPHPQRGVLGFLHVAGIDQLKAVETVTEEEWLPAFMYISEWTHQWLDYITRTTGRLTKSVRIANADGIALSGLNMEHEKRNGKAMGVMEDCYPQLLQGIYLCNAPSWIQVVWRLVRPLLPKRVIEKIDIMSPQKNKKELKRCFKHISEEDLPERFGGQNRTWPVYFPTPAL